MQIIETIVYSFDELSEKAKKYALNKYSHLGTSDNWWDDIFINVKDLGIQLNGFDLDRGQKIEGEFIWSETEIAEKIILEYGEGDKIRNLCEGFLRDRNLIYDNWQYIDGAPVDEDKLEDEINDIEHKFQQAILWEYWKVLKDEYEYLYSDEYLEEFFDINEYKFTENGTIFNF